MATALVGPLTLIAAQPAQAANLPPGFVEGLVANLHQPTALRFTPDGRMLIATKGGQLHVFQNGVMTQVLDLSAQVCTEWERGLGGLAIDPNFGQGSNRTIYLYYTFKRGSSCPTTDWQQPDPPPDLSTWPVNRLSKFTLADNNTVAPGSEVPILDNIPSVAIHNGGHMEFNPADGKLYVSVGDGGCKLPEVYPCSGSNPNARRSDWLLGKMLRINSDGTVPSDNPFASSNRRCGNPAGDTGTGTCSEIWATGLRNPFRFAIKPESPHTMHINDVGTNSWEEVNLGAKGADYGWNLREGPCLNVSEDNFKEGAPCPPPPAGITDPVFAYTHSPCGSIVGGAFVPEGIWPAPYSGSYLYGDYSCGRISRLAPKSDGGYRAVTFADGIGEEIVDLEFGPYENTQALYYTTFVNGGSIRRIVYGAAADLPPTASFTASTTSAPSAPATVTFNASASVDPDSDPLTYHWDFGDGTTATVATPVTNHTYLSEGGFTVTLRVQDDARFSSPVTKRIEVGDPPTATITSPPAGTTFAVGQTVNLAGSGTDPDETLTNARFSWTVIRHHNTHTHPLLGPITGKTLSLLFPEPEDLSAATNSYLEAVLTVTDSSGISRSVSRDLLPKKVSLTLTDNRSTAMRLEAGELDFFGSGTFVAWQGSRVRLNAPTPQQFGDRYYRFRSWSDGGAATHDIVTPGSPTTYQANFDRFSGIAPDAPPPPPPPPPPPTNVPIRGIASLPSGFGYWVVDTDGKVEAFGEALHYGDTRGVALFKPITGIASTPTGKGYWLVATDGGVFSFGDAQFWGSTGGRALNQPVVGMASTPSGKGYWLVATDGGIFSFGDAQFWGSEGGSQLFRPVVGMDATPTGKGYWLVAADGGIFTFGDAPFKGSTGGQVLNRPVVGMESTPTGSGYWLVASDGGVFAFTDAAYLGSTGASPGPSPTIGMARTPNGAGYWLAREDDTFANFGNAPAL